MIKLLLIFTLFFFHPALAQEKPVQTTELNELLLVERNGTVKIDAEKPAYFPLGIQIFKDEFTRYFRPQKIISASEAESCEITFIIDKEGHMTEIKAFGKNESFNQEAIRAVSKIKQKWVPAEINGEKVRYRFRLPLTVALNKK
ncbi:energy transducer TonB [uncultured Chryseobacterium sp.]|uniref:energy transducer TonB n=1 Tax=uncultured Chryseobacterium sp. TaxID=259322 RepID=UPI002600E034|nr:energy transducer TonB [uncultured Chryseobacterium sp.]